MLYTTFNGGLGYEGKVTLTLKSNDRVLKSQIYKNSGTIELFKFLGNCLAGRFAEAEKILPNQILLLYNQSQEPIPDNATNVIARSEPIGLAQVPIIIEEEESIKVTYNFEVHYKDIEGDFNQIALYGNTYSNAANFSAYHYLVNEWGEFEKQNVATWSATTVLLIEWELSISNKNTFIGNTQEEK